MARQQNAAGVYYDLETGEVSPVGSPPPGTFKESRVLTGG